MEILSHRGLDFDCKDGRPESSRDAFQTRLTLGFGIEFDVRWTRDGRPVVIHDTTLARMSAGLDTRVVDQINFAELPANASGEPMVPRLEDILELLAQHKNRIGALHLKGEFQIDQAAIVSLARVLGKFPEVLKSLIVFDLKPENARILHRELPAVACAPSVAHPYDVARYNQFTNGTLYQLEEILSLRDLYSWVWLDEWDTLDVAGTKRFYVPELVERLRDRGFKIALVTPELHKLPPDHGAMGDGPREGAMLPGHADAASREALLRRIEQILVLGPDAVCTDFPEAVRTLSSPETGVSAD